jgi:polyhydroxyalkanoate synthase
VSSLPKPQQDAAHEAHANSALLEAFLRDLPTSATAGMAGLLHVFAGADKRQLARLRALEEAYYRDLLALWTRLDAPAARPVAGAAEPFDGRFEAAEWSLPFFQYIRQVYLLNSRYLLQVGELAQLDPPSSRRLKFQLRQLADAMSPNNYPATNPEVIKLAAQTGGESLAQGLKLLAGDIARGRISMTDEAAFAVGRNLAVTPGAVIFENEVMQLIQYAPAAAQVHAYPLLIVPPFINKYYVLDLRPENSFVRYCVEQGFSTFMVSWRNIPAHLGHLAWDDYIEQGVLAPLEVVKALSGAAKVNTLGFCVGGTLLCCSLAVMAARKQDTVASLSLLATMLDYAETGDISIYIDREFVESVEQEFSVPGVMPGAKLAHAFASLRANDLIWHFVINNYLKGRSPPAFDLLYWNADSSNLPGRLYAYYLRNMYLENNLRIPGKLSASGVPLNLGAVSVPAYVLATRDDHIVPWRSAYASVGLLGGAAEFVLGASGHVAGIVNPASANRRHYWVNAAAGVEADAWFAGATRQPGSWWKHWAAWLQQRSGPTKPAAKGLGNAQHAVIEPAPGRYVRDR